MDTNKSGKENKNCVRDCNKEVSESLIEKVTFEQRLEKDERANLVNSWRRVSQTGYSKCKGHEAGTCLGYRQNCKDVRVIGVE